MEGKTRDVSSEMLLFLPLANRGLLVTSTTTRGQVFKAYKINRALNAEPVIKHRVFLLCLFILFAALTAVSNESFAVTVILGRGYTAAGTAG